MASNSQECNKLEEFSKLIAETSDLINQLQNEAAGNEKVKQLFTALSKKVFDVKSKTHNIPDSAPRSLSHTDIEINFTSLSYTFMDSITENLNKAKLLKDIHDSQVAVQNGNIGLPLASQKRSLPADEDPSELSATVQKKPRFQQSNYYGEKVQSEFGIKVDNSSENAWKPPLTHKPNAMKPLHESLTKQQWHLESTPEYPQPSHSYSHPYEFEINAFGESNHFKTLANQRFMSAVLDQAFNRVNSPLEPLRYIDNVDDLKAAIQEMKKFPVIGIDTEAHNFRTFQGITCLIQLSTDEQDYIIDPFKIWKDVQLLNEVTTDPKIVKVFHGATFDLDWMQRDFGVYCVNLFDTYTTTKHLEFEKKSLAFLVDRYCNHEMEKEYQLADWRQRPLTQQHLTYARKDTRYLPYIYRLMNNELLDKGLLEETLKECNALCLKKHSKNILEPDSYLKTLSKRQLLSMNTNQQRIAFKGLYEWRDQVSRMCDESTGYVLPVQSLIKMAMSLPVKENDVAICCGRTMPRFVKNYLSKILAIISHAKAQPLEMINCTTYMNDLEARVAKMKEDNIRKAEKEKEYLEQHEEQKWSFDVLEGKVCTTLNWFKPEMDELLEKQCHTKMMNNENFAEERRNMEKIYLSSYLQKLKEMAR